MSPYKIEMIVSRFSEQKDPLYKVIVYDKNGKIMIMSDDTLTKEQAVNCIARYCSISI